MSEPQDTTGTGPAAEQPAAGAAPVPEPTPPAPPAADPAPDAAGWSWGPLGTGTPGYGPPSTPGYGPPSGAPEPGAPQYGAPQYGAPQYGAPQYGAPQYGAPQYGAPQYGAPVGVTPVPVQRGIVPLRPLGLGEIYDGAFRAIRANPRVMFGFSAVVVTALVVLQTFVEWYSFGWIGDWASTPVGAEADITAGDALGASVGYVVLFLASYVASTILTGLLTVSVSRSVIGTVVGVGEAWQTVRPQLWRLLLLTLLVIVIVFAPLVVLVVGVVALAAADAVGASVALGLLGLVAYVCFAVWVMTRTTLAPAALVLERQKVVAGLKRGWALSRGSFWRIFGIVLLTNIIVGFVAGLVSFPASLVAMLVSPTDLFSPASLAIQGVATIIASVVTTPFYAAVVALLYIDLRIRREGLDVTLHRAAEEAAAGRAA